MSRRASKRKSILQTLTGFVGFRKSEVEEDSIPEEDEEIIHRTRSESSTPNKRKSMFTRSSSLQDTDDIGGRDSLFDEVDTPTSSPDSGGGILGGGQRKRRVSEAQFKRWTGHRENSFKPKKTLLTPQRPDDEYDGNFMENKMKIGLGTLVEEDMADFSEDEKEEDEDDNMSKTSQSSSVSATDRRKMMKLGRRSMSVRKSIAQKMSSNSLLPAPPQPKSTPPPPPPLPSKSTTSSKTTISKTAKGKTGPTSIPTPPSSKRSAFKKGSSIRRRRSSLFTIATKM